MCNSVKSSGKCAILLNRQENVKGAALSIFKSYCEGRIVSVLGVSSWPDNCNTLRDRFVGLVVKASASRAEDPGFESPLRRDFFPVSSHTSDLKLGTPVATLPGAWRSRVSAGTGWPGVSIM